MTRRIVLGQCPSEETPASAPTAQIENCARYIGCIRAARKELERLLAEEPDRIGAEVME